MAELTNSDFMSAYEVAQYLDGVIKGRQKNKTTFLFDQFGDRSTTESPYVNLDEERDQRNVMGEYVHPKADASYIDLPDYGTKRLGFAYAKEAINTDDFVTLNQREIGDDFGKVDVNANDAKRLQQKLSNALGAFDNLKERAARDILFYGAHTAEGPKFSKVVWNLGRKISTADVDYLTGEAVQVDLTTLVGNGGAGKRAWDSTGGTKAPTPYLDIKNMVQVATNRGTTINKIVMDSAAYDMLEADINANYKDAATLTLAVAQRVELKIIPEVEAYERVTFRRMLPIGNAGAVPIYTYTGVYIDRHAKTEKEVVKTPYVPSGYVVAIPAPSNQFIRYGRIMHRKAMWNAMPVWINTWQNEKSGEIEQELHTSFALAAYDINSVISWKVAA